MNALYVGLNAKIPAPKKPCLFIHDDIPDVPLAKIFDPTKHSLDVFSKMTPRRARELAELLYTAVPEGQNTLTVRNGKRALAPILRDAERFDRIKTDDDEARAMLDDLLFIPELRKPLTRTDKTFPLRKHSIIFARMDRKEIGDFAALVLGLILIGMYKGQLVIPDFGFYGRDSHASLVRENRLIAGINFFDELPDRLRKTVLLIKDKTASRALYEDAVLLAKFKGYTPNTNAFNDEVAAAMGPGYRRPLAVKHR